MEVRGVKEIDRTKKFQISVRTLHHYDTISVLSPRRNPDNGYREYTNEDMDKLQQMLFFKECGFSLAKIKELLDGPNFDRRKAFDLQKVWIAMVKDSQAS